MALNWNEIRVRAASFSNNWKDAKYEKSETHSFYNEFFQVFGVERKSVARYEELVTKLDNTRGYIDLFWPGVLLVEQKSAGQSLEKAAEQAGEYFDALAEAEKPRYQLVCDFQSFDLLDRDSRNQWQFRLEDLKDNIELFGFFIGRQPRDFREQDLVSIQASELIGELYDELSRNGHQVSEINEFLVRLVFCLFADDTGIFEPRDIFHEFLEVRTNPDGSDTGLWLDYIYDTLNTPVDQRSSKTDEDINRFPYVDGKLFEGKLSVQVFDSAMREKLLEICQFDWSEISPAVFGSLFQSVMDPEKRRAIGAHYTTEQNILKVIEPLFLDDLRAEFEKLRKLKRNRIFRLKEFQKKLGELTFFDPACGCGNFLIIAYRELRELEISVLKELIADDQLDAFAQSLSLIDVNQFYGIEIEEFPARIAQTALWMMDHIMNNELGAAFGTVYTRIPLKSVANLHIEDALEIDWNKVLPANQCSFVFGNPPFIGAKYQSSFQRNQIHRIANLTHKKGTLDYVTGWFIKAGEYVSGSCAVGFVATNSIAQGEQVGQLWPVLFDRYNLQISFAHSTFSWSSEARGAAHVHVVIIGLTRQGYSPKVKRLFTYLSGTDTPNESLHSAISPYLVSELEAFPYVTVQSSKYPINGFKSLKSGSKPIDDGNYIFRTKKERDDFLRIEPNAAKFIHPYVGAKDLIQGTTRYILALQSASPDELANLPEVRKRINAVKDFRLSRRSAPTVKLAQTPREYHINVLPSAPFLVVPVTSSERRDYVPIAWLNPPVIPNIDTRILEDATLADFALLTSKMHMTWLRFVGGRLESRYRYSIGLVYNTFPRPKGNLTALDPLAQDVLAAREEFTETSLEKLYDPDFMPKSLYLAHQKLDKAVERLYRKKPFQSEQERIEHMIGLYEQCVQPILVSKRQKKYRR